MFQISEVLKKVPFFRTLGKDGIGFIVERLKFKPFEKDEVICNAGDPGDKMFIIINGKVKVVVSGEDGEEKVIASLGGGDYFGEMALLTGEPRSATVITTDPSEMFILNKSDFDLIVERFPSITLSMGKIMSQRLRDTLQKAAKSSSGKTETAVKGDLSEKKLVDVLKFCENNSLNGKVIVRKDGEEGQIFYDKGELQKVTLGNLSEDTALDTLLKWEEGEFIIEPKPLQMEVEKKAEEKKAPSHRIVIVNNSMVVQKLLQKTFESMGYEIYAVETATKGKNLIDSLKPNLVISDTKLPDSTGIEFLTAIRENNNIPFILLTDSSTKPQYEQEAGNTADVSFTNSKEIGEVVKVVESILK
jgi:CRP-like cAMP-binding protein/CheY-like chemotaxis protein